MLATTPANVRYAGHDYPLVATPQDDLTWLLDCLEASGIALVERLEAGGDGLPLERLQSYLETTQAQLEAVKFELACRSPHPTPSPITQSEIDRLVAFIIANQPAIKAELSRYVGQPVDSLIYTGKKPAFPDYFTAALDLVDSGKVFDPKDPKSRDPLKYSYLVFSQEQEYHFYLVSDDGRDYQCNCPSRQAVCKHSLAVMLWQVAHRMLAGEGAMVAA